MTWPEVRLSDVARIVMGQSPDGSLYNNQGQGKPLITGSGQMGEKVPRPIQYSRSGAKQSHIGDIIMSIRASIGDLNWSDREYFLGRGVAAIRCSDRLDANFAWWVLLESKVRLENQASGSTFKQIKTADLENLRFKLPSIPEQQRIAAILDQAEALQAKRRQALAKLDTLTQSLFLEMFGNPRSNPKGWGIASLEDLGIVSGGLQLTPQRQKHCMKAPYLRVANVFRDRVDLSDVKIMGLSQPELKKTSLKTGDLMIVEGHGNPEEIGRCAVWGGQIADCVHQNHLIRVRFNAEKVNPHFVSAFLNSRPGREQVLKCGKTTSGLNTLSTKNVKSFCLFAPPKSLQDEFSKRQESIRTHAEGSSGNLQLMTALSNALKTQAFVNLE